jgi:hypothetical protein
MVKPAAHDSFYKCSIHFSLILINYNFFFIFINKYNIIFFSPSAENGRQA